LPPALSARIDWGSLRLESSSFVEVAGASRFAEDGLRSVSLFRAVDDDLELIARTGVGEVDARVKA
jgi:hypothetical protein